MGVGKQKKGQKNIIPKAKTVKDSWHIGVKKSKRKKKGDS